MEPVNFKLSLIVLSCFSDMADKKRKITNSFQNVSYESKLSKIDRGVGIGCLKVWK